MDTVVQLILPTTYDPSKPFLTILETSVYSPGVIKGGHSSKIPQLVEVLTLLSVTTDGHSGLTDFCYNMGPLPALFNNSQNFFLLTGGVTGSIKGANFSKIPQLVEVLKLVCAKTDGYGNFN